MVRGILNIFKCSSFSPFSICRFCFSLCPSIYGADFERMITSRCLCAIIRQCTITLSLIVCPPFCFYLSCLIVIAASTLHLLYRVLACARIVPTVNVIFLGFWKTMNICLKIWKETRLAVMSRHWIY